ncbi:helix-turn-helix domain-containing protein [Psychrobacillus psychrodurans]|uniref:helix-turn-helix domain-containing protein n=1 Tax=Psychrobacillus TaxID=1221880 RepID=UPI0008E26172|nr:helix-turn-helix transcriptional regulator [Psychrobacillus psychrodurans]MCK1995742.1 helix-turn-helix domain-containing protein [Psychrobacillus psychrodurans]MCZ8539007.1 helix-turn-helix domain-containing protein [Psychrobacillus psychrodurans]SFM26745.1 DNA-binding transcriptional regulator, XRE-family HTH domain [Psychrobacillus psychrodurans]
MAFGEQLRAYREKLDITQMEAAKILGIDHSALSKYEKGDLGISIELLMKIKDKYNIPDDQFLYMLQDKRYKSNDPILEAKESKTRYIETFQEEYVKEIIHLKEYRDFTMDIVNFAKNDKDRRKYILNRLNKD